MKAKLPHIAIIYDRYHKASKEHKGVLEIRITHNRKQKYISTGIKLLPKEWREKTEEVVNTPDAAILNKLLNNKLSSIKEILYTMVQEGNININDIPRKLDNQMTAINFIDFCIKRANVRKYKKAKDSQERYDRFIRLFLEYGKIKDFDDITEENIIAYDKYLASKKLQINSKWNNYHRFLNSFIIDAINEGLLCRNPYKWLNIETGKSSNGYKRCLTPEEFRRIKDTQMPTKSIERVKDLFIFQTYMCLSYSDLRDFDSNEIIEISGMKVYTGKRNKTHKDFTIPILPGAMAILNKYNGVLPIISNVKYNEYLKIVAQTAGIDKPVSTHWARHTGATLLLNEGVDIRIIAKICGHSSTRITEQVYAKLLDESVIKAIAPIKNSF